MAAKKNPQPLTNAEHQARWRAKRNALAKLGATIATGPLEDDHAMAIDSDGRPLPYTPDQVRAVVKSMALEDGTLLGVLFQHDNRIGMHVFGPPSQDILDTLEQVAQAYRVMLRGH